MKILVIPDIHLKPWLFNMAENILNEGKADKALCLMDIPCKKRTKSEEKCFYHK